MKQLFARHIIHAAAQLERVAALFTERKKKADFKPDAPLSAKSKNIIAKSYAQFATSAEAMAAPITAKSARSAVTKLRARKQTVSFSDLDAMSTEIANVMQYEMGAVALYCLPRGADAFYTPKEPLFGKEVEARIPKAADDISEAGKCFAVGRYTAAVFHLMRAMEVAVQTISASLKIENVEREWGKLLSDIGAKIQAMPKGDDRDEWSQVHANLYHVKQAWRNDTMHPKATYTEEEAREVFDAMKAFMRHLASMLPPSAEELIG